MRRAEEDLWPADEAHAPLLDEWLQQTPRLLAQKDALVALAAELQAEAVAAPDAGARSVVASQQEGVARGLGKLSELVKLEPVIAARLERAESLRKRTIRDHQAAWDACRAALAADVRFKGFTLPDVPGLVPLGGNAQSGLQEFYLLDSAGEPGLPVRRADGGFDVGPMMGLVFVLIPGGLTRVPAPKTNGASETVSVTPFLLARYELSQAQFVRLCSDAPRNSEEAFEFNPSNQPQGLQWASNGPGQPAMDHGKAPWSAVAWTHPVNQVTWEQADRVMRRWGLLLPRLSQWMHAGRAGAEEALDWASGRLSGMANLRIVMSDATGQRMDADGFVYSAPVGALPPNPWGLHGVIGNVAEWCRDGYSDEGWLPSASDTRRGIYVGLSCATERVAIWPGLQQQTFRNAFEVVGMRAAMEITP